MNFIVLFIFDPAIAANICKWKPNMEINSLKWTFYILCQIEAYRMILETPKQK